MAATAPPISGNSVHLSGGNNVSISDNMDVHTDHRIDADGDMNVDTSSDHVVNRRDDDDLSLQDAGTDGDVDVRTGSDDQDDYMVDKDDLIEEDDDEYDLVLEDADEAIVGSLANAQDEAADAVKAPNPVDTRSHAGEAFDEDLIDYSDDEEEPQGTFESTSNREMSEQHIDAEQALNPPTLSTDGARGYSPADEGAYNVDHVHADEEVEEVSLNWDEGEDEQWEQPQVDATYTNVPHPDEGDGHVEEHQQQADATYNRVTHADEAEGSSGEQQPQQGSLAGDSPEHIAVEQRHGIDEELKANVTVAGEGKDADTNFHPQEPLVENAGPSYFETGDDEGQSTLQIGALYPVTVNYNGAEFWLFKPHDFDDAEWLLEDEAVANQPFLYLIHACRAKLNEDLNNETELGLRFDSFPGLELYEDCTACAYSNLNELLNLYTSLHAQDGQTSPEPFYVTLQFRPRVSALVGDLKKAVQEGIGFSGLRRAIDAGLNNFSMMLSANQGDAYDGEWEGEGQDEDYHPGEGEQGEQYTGEGKPGDPYARAGGDEDEYAGAGNDEEQYAAEDEAPYHHDGEGADHGDTRSRDEPAKEEEQGRDQGSVEQEGDTEADRLHQQLTGHDTYADAVRKEEAPSKVSAQTPPGSVGSSRTSAAATYDQAEDDLIDYSDDEEDAPQPDRQSGREASSTSATLQPDELSEHESYTNPLAPSTEDGQHDLPNEGDEGEEGFYATAYTEEEVGDGYENVGHGGEVEVNYWQPDDGEEAEEGEEEGFQGGDEYAAFEFEDYEDGGAENACADEDSYRIGPEEGELDAERPDPSAAAQTDIVDDEFDLEYDEEAGPIKQAEVPATVAALTNVALSTGLEDLGSPQGQKRPLGEVDGGFDGAGDSTDAKRPKL